MKKRKTVDLRTRQEWRQWLQKHHKAESEIWLVFHKRHTGQTSVSYDEAVKEALCFGWIDSLITRLDDARYARKFTPRKPDSRWSTANRRRYADVQTRGLLAEAGRKRPPTARSGDTPRPSASASAIPPDIESAFKTNPLAWKHFEQLAPSYRRRYIVWISMAKRSETKQKRLRDAIALLASGRKLGLK